MNLKNLDHVFAGIGINVVDPRRKRGPLKCSIIDG